ncbi:endonuclease/exonuclease/phosphatase [Arthrobacter crystallopoietes BAB-32]|uniref:Endonuclease/exonuclease/phosphatase n=2 Tax=Crystallibacter crystallopoietes TaxID=37928 RepID=N1UZM2_9MICC|nr:endonuclease/exonuclease/phosphatase [Arthrobacter crystallopoietes BAB-32]
MPLLRTLAAMTRLLKPLLAALAAAALSAVVVPAAHAAPQQTEAAPHTEKVQQETVRIATYNASLNRSAAGELLRDLSTPENQQARNIAEVIQRNDPDILLLNEFDYVEDYAAVDLFRQNYLQVSQNGQDPVEYPYAYTAPSNTGVDTGVDLNNDGVLGTGDDAFGFGLFPGQYGMVVLSKYPIDTANVRTFQNFLWKDMPGNLMPTDYYSAEAQELLRLSSKSHWDVPVQVGNQAVHVLASHPTPPSFDGPEDKNGKRNFDEIRFWADYVAGGPRASYIYDDGGDRGGLQPGSRFVVMGDQNSDPRDGDSWPGAIGQLLEHPRIQDPLPASRGAVEAAALQGGANISHLNDPRFDTADFNDNPAPGNLRADYVLPSKNLLVRDAGVFWPKRGEPGSELTGEFPFPTSDHRLVWTDVQLRG